jgi:hypothetical protein
MYASDEQGFALTMATVRVGQGPQNDIVLDDDTVSKVHALLEFADGGWRLTDLDSRNGTYLEGVRLAPQVPTPVPGSATVAFGAVSAAFHAREDVDVADLHAGERVTEQPLSVRRAGFRLPVWLLAVILILIAALVVFFFVLTGDAAAWAALEPAELPIATPLLLDAA